MAGSTILKGHARQALVRTTTQGFTGSAGAALGVHDVSAYSRLCGLISIVGSARFQYQMGASSGAYQVTSSFAVNSGGNVFDVLNYGHAVSLSLTQAASQTNATILVYAEPLR